MENSNEIKNDKISKIKKLTELLEDSVSKE